MEGKIVRILNSLSYCLVIFRCFRVACWYKSLAFGKTIYSIIPQKSFKFFYSFECECFDIIVSRIHLNVA